MTTVNENNDSTQTVVKTRKPRSPNKPKTLDKQVAVVNKKLNKFLAKQQEVLEASESRAQVKYEELISSVKARVREKFAEKKLELFESLTPEVRAQVDPDFELPVVQESAAE